MGDVPAGDRTWLAAHEGWYGPPLGTAQRCELVRWLADEGYDGYAYSPKDDDHHRNRWREPYPPEAVAGFEQLAATCDEVGVDLAMMVSPGLDWRSGDPSEIDALAAKLARFADLGAAVLSVNWDDVPGHGAEAGAEHGGAVAEVVGRVGADHPDLSWIACPVDYATATPTAYLRAFAAAVPAAVEIGWTGASVVAPGLEAAEVDALERPLGRRLAFCENVPVNDLGMADVLHLGPYPERDPALVGQRRVLVNFMHRAEASKPGLALAARFWHREVPPDRPAGEPVDREAAWEDLLASQPALAPLARSCRSWVGDPGPDPLLLAWADAAVEAEIGAGANHRLADFLRRGCRDGLDPGLATEVEPWLAQWDLEAAAMLAALDLLAAARPPSVPALWAAAGTWDDARRGRPQVFGIRFARYPLTRRHGDRLVADAGAVVHGTNLTDRVWAAVLERLDHAAGGPR